MYIDVHSHILPNVDDGSKSAEESLEMLKMLKQQGVGAVVLSPHFYPSAETSFEEYRNRIDSAFSEFTKKADDSLPELFLGSEVHYFNGISAFSDLDKLCIANSGFILLEIPYRPITQKVLNEIIDINLSRHLMPILAHIERYSIFDGYQKLLSVIEEGYALGQVNAYSFLQFSTRRAVNKLLKRGLIYTIASDAHGKEKNPPRIGEAFEYIEKKFGDRVADDIKQNSNRLYESFRGTVK